MLQEQFKQVLLEHQLVKAGDKVLVAVSGGADSTALLHLFCQTATSLSLTLMAAHLDHQLRPESSADADFVARLCQQLNIPVIIEKVDVSALAAERKTGVEDAGRQARRAFLAKVAEENDCCVIALGHHADDQAETVLFRMLRGSGLSGLAAMQLRSGSCIRPLLNVRNVILKDYLRQNGVAWREDTSNSDLTYARNRIRHQLLPLLEEFNPRVVEALNRLSRQAGDEEEFWSSFCGSLLEKHGTETVDGFAIGIELLNELSPAERRRLLRAFLQQLQGYLPAVDAGHITLVEGLLVSDRPQADLDLPGIWVGRRYDRLLCGRSKPGSIDYEIEIIEPGDYRLPTGDRLVVSQPDKLADDDELTVFFAADQVTFPLMVRSPRAGDRFQPSGMNGHKLLKDFFIDAKIDREDRQRTPVVCRGDEIIWLAGRRRCNRFYPTLDEKLLKISLLRPNQVVE